MEKNTFKIVEILGNASQALAEELLKKLPLCFHLREKPTMDYPSLDEPLEVYIRGPIVSVYPPEGRIIAVTMLERCDMARAMLTECVADMMFPGGGQIRTSFIFNPKSLGVEGWPSLLNEEVEVDVYVYPKEKANQQFSVPITHDEVITSDDVSGELVDKKKQE